MEGAKKLIMILLLLAILIGGASSFWLKEMSTPPTSELPQVPRKPLNYPVNSSVRIVEGIPRIALDDGEPIAFTGLQLYPSFSPYGSLGDSTVWKERIDYASHSGFTYVCPWLFWPVMDTHKTGRPEDAADWINWEPLDEFFEYAASKGVYVIPYFWFAYTPQWWYTEYGDSHVQVNNEGKTTGDYQSMACFNATEAHWKYVDQVLEALVERYKDHPALLGWALSVGSTSENNYPGGNLYGVPGWHDYSDFSKAQFREWMREKYGNDIFALRKAWSNNTVTFENAEIPQPLPPAEPSVAAVNSGGDQRREYYDWQFFRLEQKKACREHFGRLYKQVDPDHIVLTMSGVFPFWGGMTEYQGTVWPAVAAMDYYDVINAPYVDGVILQPPINEYAWLNVRWGFLYSYVKYTHSRGKVFSPCFEDFGVNDKLWVIDGFIHFCSALGCGVGWVEGSEGEAQVPWSEVEREEIKKCWYLSHGVPGAAPRREKFALIDSPVLLSLDYQEKGEEWSGFKALDLAATVELLADAGLEYDVLTEYDVLAEPSLLDSYSAVALVSLFRMTDELVEVLVRYRERGGGLFIAGRTAVFDEYGNQNTTYLQRLLGVSEQLGEHAVDSGESWRFIPEDGSGLIQGTEGKVGDPRNVYNIPTFDYHAEGYKVVGYLDSDPHVGVVGYKDKTVFWFSRLGQPWGLFKPDPTGFEATLRFMRNLYDYYCICRDEIDTYWIGDIGGQYKFLLTDRAEGFNGSVGFNLKSVEEKVSGKYLIYDWTDMKALAVNPADEKGIVRAEVTLRQNQPVLLGISKCTSSPTFVAAEWAVLRGEAWDNHTQTLRVHLNTMINKKAQIAIYVAGKEVESINVIGGEKLETEKDKLDDVLKVSFTPNRPNATLEVQFSEATHSWLIDGAIYEVNIEYFPNHKLTELTAMIPHLENLSVRTIYLLPIWECASGAQYLILDHYKINPRYGDESDLKELVKTAHSHGIRVILDLVTSLTTEGSFIFENHPDWILLGDDGEMQRYFPFPDWGWALDCANPEVMDYFAKVAKYYVEEFDIDGWRVDSPQNNYDPEKVSGDHSRLSLLRSAKSAMLAVKPYAVFCAETPGPTAFWSEVATEAEPLFDEMCEISYNYAFCGFMGGSDEAGYNYAITEPFTDPQWQTKYIETIMNKIAHNRAASEEFVDFVKNQRILHNRLRANFVENHDTERVSRAFPEQHKSLFVLAATMPGVPVVHAGEEIGESTHPEHGPVVVGWENGDKELEAFYVRVLRARSENEALRYGDISNVWNGGDRIIAFLRSYSDNHVIVALNFNSEGARTILSVPVEEIGLDPEAEYQLRDELCGGMLKRTGGDLKSLELVLEPYGSRVIVLEPSVP